MKLKKILSVFMILALFISVLPDMNIDSVVSDSVEQAEAADFGIENLGNVVASMDTSGGSTSISNLSLIASGISDGAYTYEWIDGKYALKLSGFAYFTANDSAISSSDNNLIVEITYFDDGLGTLNLEYNSSVHNYSLKQVQLTDTDKWQKTIIVIDNAQFKNAQNANADFRVNGASFCSIKFVKGSLNPAGESKVNVTASSYSEFKGKTVSGYQAWFTATEGKEWNRTFDYYPNVEDYDQNELVQSAYADLGSGEPALLFSSNNKNTIDTHFSWMQEYGIDGAAIQRFSPNITGRNIILNKEGSHLYKIKQAAEATDRIFYIMYDISGGKAETYIDDMKFDWVYNIEQSLDLLSSPSYATVTENGVTKPVVCIWGLGVADRLTNGYDEIIDFFKSRGCYVIIGTSTYWRTEPYLNSYLKADMISPWAVGTYSDKNGINNKVVNTYAQDVAYLNNYGIDFYPVVWSGFSWCLWNNGRPNMIPRNAGQFMWDQFYSLKQNLGTTSVYIAMFDEYDEGTAIAKNATDYFEIPKDRFYITSSIDGYWLSSDFQLRVCEAGINMIKGQTSLRSTCDVAHSEGPVYYRNSFEKKNVVCKETQYNGVYNVDPCFKNEGVVSTSSASVSASIATNSNAKTGNYVATLTGSASSNSSKAVYRISQCAIKITEGMKLSYSMNAANNAGRNAYVELICSDGTYISTKGYSSNGVAMGAGTKGSVGSWTDYSFTFGDSSTAGKTITSIALCYSGSSGNYTTYFDDIIVSDDGTNTPGGDEGETTEPEEEIPALDRTGWSATASKSNGIANNALDGDISTRWDTTSYQTGNETFTVNLGKAQFFDTVELLLGTSTNDWPAAYEIYVSLDGVNWGSPVKSGSGAAESYYVGTQYAQYVKVVQTGTKNLYWSIHEFNLKDTKYDTHYNVAYVDGSNVIEIKSIALGQSAGSLKAALEADGKLFAGWYNKAVNLNSASAIRSAASSITNISSVRSNTAFYAGWINIGTVSKDSTDAYASSSSVSELELIGVQVRINDPSGLRFITRISDNLVAKVEALNGSNSSLRPDSTSDKGVGYGTVTTLASKLSGSLEKDVNASTVLKGNVVCPAVQNFMDYNGYVLYTCVVKGIPTKYYQSDIAARPYITYVDANGNTQTYYTTEDNAAGGGYKTSLYKAAQAFMNSGVSADTKNWLQNNIINAVN